MDFLFVPPSIYHARDLLSDVLHGVPTIILCQTKLCEENSYSKTVLIMSRPQFPLLIYE